MSPAPLNPLDQVASVLAPNSNVSLAEKVGTLQTFATTLQGITSHSFFFLLSKLTCFVGQVSMQQSVQILSAVPLGLFYNGFSVEDDRLTSVLCELIQSILSPFSYDHIVSPENKVKRREKKTNSK